MKTFLGLFAGIALFPFIGVGIANVLRYDGHFRYPCQDAENWTLNECRPPICLADSTCSMLLVPEESLYVEN